MNLGNFRITKVINTLNILRISKYYPPQSPLIKGGSYPPQSPLIKGGSKKLRSFLFIRREVGRDNSKTFARCLLLTFSYLCINQITFSPRGNAVALND